MGMNGVTAYLLGVDYAKMAALGLTNVSVSGTTITFTIAATGQEVEMTFPTPENGKNLEFDWEGTKLGVRVEGESEFEYVDLKGASIVGASFNAENKLVITLSDGTDLPPVALPTAAVDISKKENNVAKMESDGIYVGREIIPIKKADYDILPDDVTGKLNPNVVYNVYDENPGSGGGGGSYELPIATEDTLGGVKVGDGLAINEEGVLTATGGGDASNKMDKVNPTGSGYFRMGETAEEVEIGANSFATGYTVESKPDIGVLLLKDLVLVDSTHIQATSYSDPQYEEHITPITDDMIGMVTDGAIQTDPGPDCFEAYGILTIRSKNLVELETIDSEVESIPAGYTLAICQFVKGAIEGKTIANEASGEGSHAEGYSTTASGYYSHAEGWHTTAYADSSHAEGRSTTAGSIYSHAEGRETTARGENSHSEGYNTVASGSDSHAEGYHTRAIAEHSHAEGGSTEASGENSHAEGSCTVASGNSSHAEGSYTIASGYASHAEGQFNIEDTEKKYAHIVGNGSMQSRSNAYTLDWKGNAWFAGTLTAHDENGREFKVGGNDTPEGKINKSAIKSRTLGYTPSADDNGISIQELNCENAIMLSAVCINSSEVRVDIVNYISPSSGNSFYELFCWDVQTGEPHTGWTSIMYTYIDLTEW